MQVQDHDAVWIDRSAEDKAALCAGSLSWPDRKLQRWGLPCHWRQQGPFDWTGCDDVIVMPGRLSGVPTVGHSRFSADNLLDLHESGMSAEAIAQDYDVELDQVRRVLSFAAAKKEMTVAA